MKKLKEFKIENAFTLLPLPDKHQSIEKSHGRLEERSCNVLHDLRFVNEELVWEDLSSIIRVQSKRTMDSTAQEETRYYISNHQKDAPFFQSAIRSLWLIENELHDVLDITFNEDYSRKRKKNAAENFNIIRKMSLNIVRSDKTSKASLKGGRNSAGWNNDYLESLLQSFMR